MSEEDKIALVELKTEFRSFRENTNEYRVNLCSKIDKLFGVLANLPCKERGEMYRSLRVRERMMWAALGILGTLIFIHLGWR